jgi:hypothetical protein
MINLVVHATHEAGVKVGGIGAVLDGLLGAQAYNEAVERTVLIGPYDPDDGLEMERLRARRNGFTVLYHAREGIANVPNAVALAFHRVQSYHGVSILYGKRRFGTVEHEVILVDSRKARVDAINDLKGWLYAQHGLHSTKYENYPEFNYFMGGAAAQVNALHALIGDVEGAYFMAHEWLGLPALFAAQRHLPGQFKTIFYAHETATVRGVVESHPGHDLRFYNVMRLARERGLSLEQCFGDKSGNYKHAFLKAALSLDGLFAVGDLVKEELIFLEPSLRPEQIDLVYNGVPSQPVTAEAKWNSKRLLQEYAYALYRFVPTWVFSHVTRLVPSKGIWRDFRVMERLDGYLQQANETAIFYLLSSVRPTGRRSEDVLRWEWEYGWPLNHRADNGDLIAYEWDYWQAVEEFNRHAKASRIVFINQFGWSRDRCGNRMPATMEFADLRRGADVEFGQSIYEPFGIAQVEPLSSGALCAVSTACGCLGFVRDAEGHDSPNIVIGDYLHLPEWAMPNRLPDVFDIGRSQRDAVEAFVASEVAQQIIYRLPRSPEVATRLLEGGTTLSQKMSWDVVARDYLMPAMARL